MFGKRKVAALGAEFLGTGVLAFTFLTVSRSTIGIPYFVGLASGLAIIMMGLALARDVQFNPAYTVALWSGRRIGTLKALAFILVQLLGGWAAYGLYKYLVKGQVQPISGTFEWRILIAEAFGTFVFAFAAAGVLYRRTHWLVRAVVVGGAYTLGIMVASAASNGFINPAVALASNGLAWTTVLGPLLGAVVGVNLYGLLFARESELATAEVKVGRIERTAEVEAEKADTPYEAAVIKQRAAVKAKRVVRKARAKAAKSK